MVYVESRALGSLQKDLLASFQSFVDLQPYIGSQGQEALPDG